MGKIQKVGKINASDRDGSDGVGSASAVRFFYVGSTAGWCSCSGRLVARVAIEAALKTRVAGGEVEPRPSPLHVTLYLIGTTNDCYSDI